MQGPLDEILDINDDGEVDNLEKAVAFSEYERITSESNSSYLDYDWGDDEDEDDDWDDEDEDDDWDDEDEDDDDWDDDDDDDDWD